MAHGQVPEALVWWGKTYTDQNVWDAALERIAKAYEMFDHVVVSFSGGKDSTCVLNATLEVARILGRLPVPVTFIDEECISPPTEDYVRRVAQLDDVTLDWWCLPVQHRNACSVEQPYWWPWDPDARDFWVRPLPPEALTELDGFIVDPPAARLSIPATFEQLLFPVRRFGSTALLMGIRADESMMRRRAVSNKRPENWIIPTAHPGYTKVYPVYDWTTTDVWTAPKAMGWDYNQTYDLLAMHGFTPHQQRCAPPFGEEPMRDLDQWAACFPDLWDRMVARVPGAACGARYSRTELYSHGEAPTKPDGMTWETFIRQLLEEHEDPKVRRTVAVKAQQMIQRHYAKTNDPLAGHVRHPVSGLCWELVASMCLRGDLKKRRMIMEVPGSGMATDPAAWAEYRAAIAQGDT